MDEGPFRVSRPADRRGVSRPEPATQRQPEQRQPMKAEPPASNQPPVSHRTKEKKIGRQGKLPLFGAIVGIIIAILLVLWFGYRSTDSAIDTNKYQALFLTNGGEFFGKLEVVNDKYMKLTDVYYLQTESDNKTDEGSQTASNSVSSVKLIKRGDEVHDPEDGMIVSRDKIVFYENLEPEGRVAQSIDQFKKSRK